MYRTDTRDTEQDACSSESIFEFFNHASSVPAPGSPHTEHGRDHDVTDVESSDEAGEREPGRRKIRGLRDTICSFTPQWFLVTMGTGNLSLTIFSIPIGRPPWLYWLSVIVFAVDVLLFCFLMSILLVQSLLEPKSLPTTLRHPVKSLFLGPITVSFASIINLMTLICEPAWGDWMVNWIWAFWWLETVLAASVLAAVMFHLFKYHAHSHLDAMVAVWLLPSVSAIVSSSTSGAIAPILPQDHSLWTVIIGLVLWGMGVPMAMLIMAMYFQRLSLSHLPPSQVVASVFIPLGPLAQGAHGILELAKSALTLFPATVTLSRAPDAGQIFYVVAWLLAVVLWAFALLWLIFAVATFLSRERYTFHLGWWSVVFPTGIFSLATMQIGQETSSTFLMYLGTVFTCMHVVVWAAIVAMTLLGLWRGDLFGRSAPKVPQEKKKPT